MMETQTNWELYAPTHWANKRIKFRVPYTMPGELAVTANQNGIFFPEGTFLHGVELPFEIWRMYVRLVGIDDGGEILDGPFFTLGERIRLSVEDTSKNQRMTKAPSLVDILVNSLAGSTGAWEWHVPYTLVRSEGFAIQVDSLSFVNLAAVTSIRVAISYQGYLIVTEPASETR
jgi:hypothetical protein